MSKKGKLINYVFLAELADLLNQQIQELEADIAKLDKAIEYLGDGCDSVKALCRERHALACKELLLECRLNRAERDMIDFRIAAEFGE